MLRQNGNKVNLRKAILAQPILLALVALFALSALLNPEFLTVRNMNNLLLQVATDGVVAVGMTLVIITAGIDLSVGKVLALSSVIAVGMQRYVGSAWGCVLALIAGLLIGIGNGLLVTRVKINPFISTLGMRVFVEGLALGVTDTRPISGSDPVFADLASRPVLLGVPLAALAFLVLVGVGHYLLTHTSAGRGFYAVGGNAEASWLAGIKVNRYLMVAYAFTSFCAALAGVLMASRINTGSPIIGRDTDMVAIAAVLLGGTSMAGGSGTILGTLEGMLVLGVLKNGMNLFGVSEYYQTMITGLLLIVVMLIDRYAAARRKIGRKRARG